MPCGGDVAMSRPGYSEYADYGRPREARGGIRAQSRRGDFAQNWWARRWIDVLDSFGIASRIARARSYARRGQVLAIDVGSGEVTARVQGSRPQPYRVSIRVAELRSGDWRKVASALGERPVFASSLIAGRMPDRIEDVFSESGLSLFPKASADVRTACTCPDQTNPCKHIAAVHLLLGEEFDRDPFLLFRLRGMQRDELLALAGLRIASTGAAPTVAPTAPLPPDPDAFWGRTYEPDPARVVGAARVPAANAVIARRLGSFPFWTGSAPFLPTLETVYGDTASAALDALLSDA